MHTKNQYRYLLSALFGLFSLFTLASPQLLSADQASQYGCSARGIAMGNAYIALAQDASGFIYNPAGPATRPRHSFHLGYLYNKPRITVNGPGYPDSLTFDSNSRFPTLGFTLDFNPLVKPVNKMLNKLTFIPESLKPDMNVVFCLFGAMPHGGRMMVKTEMSSPGEVHFPVFGSAQDLVLLGAGASIKVHEKVYFGAGLQMGFTAHIPHAHLTMNVESGGEESVFSASTLSVEKLAFNAEMELPVVAGILVKPWDKLSVGATWRMGYHSVTFHGDIRMHSEILGLTAYDPPEIVIYLIEYYQPEQFSVGAAYQVSKKLLVSVETSYAIWSEYYLPGKVRLADYDIPGQERVDNPFQDIIIYRCGLEYEVIDGLKARFGYTYHPSPIKKRKQTFSQYMDMDQHVFSGGVGYAWRWMERFTGFPLEIDIYVQYKHLPKTTLETFDGTYTISGQHIGTGLSLQLEF